MSGDRRAMQPVTLPRNITLGRDEEHTVTTHHKGILLQKGNASWSTTLGPYHIDLTPSILNYTAFLYGEFDAKGIPKVGYGRLARYHNINIAQYALIVHDLWLLNQNPDYLAVLNNILDWYEEHKVRHRDATVWREPHDRKYAIPAGYYSAMAAGEILSFYLRMYQIRKDPRVLETAWATYKSLEIEYRDGGPRRYDENGDLWLEEFPSDPPSFVLNGFVYAMLGILDLFRVTGDERVKREFDACVRTLQHSLPRYDCGYWSLYDQRRSELVSVYYQRNVHVPQMDVLYELTNHAIFRAHRDRWLAQLNPLNIALVQVMLRVRPRWQRLSDALRKHQRSFTPGKH